MSGRNNKSRYFMKTPCPERRCTGVVKVRLDNRDKGRKEYHGNEFPKCTTCGRKVSISYRVAV